MKLVYICSPYAGDIENNVEFAKAACRYAIEHSNAPLAVHLLYPLVLNDAVPEERKIGIQMGLRVLSSCEELWVFGDKISHGMELEISEAKRMGMPIRYVGKLELRMAAFAPPAANAITATSCEMS